MDMITKIELEDALKNYIKVEKRIVEVAMIVGDIEGVWELPSKNGSAYVKDGRGWRMTNWLIDKVAMIAGDIEGSAYDGRGWRMANWSIDLKDPREGMEHLKEMSCRVDFEIALSRAPDSDNPKIGLEVDREGVFKDEYEREPTVTRRVEFPYEYLLTTGWEERARAKHAEREERMREFYLELAKETVKSLEGRLTDARKAVEKYTK